RENFPDATLWTVPMPGIREHPGNNNPFNIALMVFLKLLQSCFSRCPAFSLRLGLEQRRFLYAIKR
ncbi:MAG: hypothetical protein J0I90_09890, partial [Nitrosospira sp.]|nr:hypothetical protein [Nitrosospira sp.]